MQLVAILLLMVVVLNGYGQNNHKQLYQKAFDEQYRMLRGEISVDFKRAVFLTENAYHKGALNYNDFTDEIARTGVLLRNLIRYKGFSGYKTAGNWAVFSYMTDSLPINNYQPCTYDFDDFWGGRDWTNMFTTKLMRTRTGNCHSLPYYYKILCEEIDATACLALAPNHIYIKHLDENGQWTNVELTNGGFPRDQWIIRQMAISVEAIKNEVYMKPLTDTESIALTMFDLASAYEFQFGPDSFYLSVVDTTLVYFPHSIPLLMCKANFYARMGTLEQVKSIPDTKILKNLYDQYMLVSQQISRLGHRDMPPDLYEEWIQSVEDEKIKRNYPQTK